MENKENPFFEIPSKDASKKMPSEDKGRFLKLAKKMNDIELRLHKISSMDDIEIYALLDSMYRTSVPFDSYVPFLMVLGDWYRIDLYTIAKEYYALKIKYAQVKQAYNYMLDAIIEEVR